MQKEIEGLNKEEISKQLDKLVLCSGNYETESETNSESGSSFGDETDAFEENLQLENDLAKAGFDSEEEEALSLETEEDGSEGDDLDEQNSNESDEQLATWTAGRSFQRQKEDEYLVKLKEIQGEMGNLKEMINEFARDIKSSLTEIIFDQFSQLEKELFDDEEPANGEAGTKDEQAKEEATEATKSS